jgi:4-hydroxy-3-methylbut-2-enyl diphosphate reductase
VRIILANPRGFCAGVDRAIEIVNRVLSQFDAPIYVRHEVVHNKTVVGELRSRGAIFVDEIAEVPEGATVIFSAHGVSQLVREQAEAKKLRVFDATCPLVKKVHNEVKRSSMENRETILIGHAGHPEVEGTMGQYEDPDRIFLVEKVKDVHNLPLRDPSRVSFATQTTLSVDDTEQVISAIKQKVPGVKGPKKDDICYATQNRQDAVKELTSLCDLILVVGSANSSNSNRLRELAERQGVRTFLIDDADEIDASWVSNVRSVGITSGASAPESLVEGVITRLNCIESSEVENIAIRDEDVEFSLPGELQ